MFHSRVDFWPNPQKIHLAGVSWSIDQMSVDQMSADQMSADQISVDQMSAKQTHTNHMCYTKVHQPNVCRLNGIGLEEVDD